jgi:hypothetical protein
LACQDERFLNSPLDVKEDVEYAVDFALHFPLMLCLRAITANPALVASDNLGQESRSVGGRLTRLFADVDTLLLLISSQK